MQSLQVRAKAIVAGIVTLVAQFLAFYQTHSNMTLKDIVSSFITAIIVGVAVHQTPNASPKKGA